MSQIARGRIIAIAVLILSAFGFFTFGTIGPDAPAFAGQAARPRPDTAEGVVQRMLEAIRKLRSTDDTASRNKLIATVDESLALDSLSQQALGAQWGKLDSAEREHFQHLLKDLLEKLAYPQAAQFFTGLEVKFDKELSEGERRIVRTSVKRPEGGVVSINYVLQRTRPGSWQVVDIDLDGQSLVQTVARQIQAVLHQGSYESLVAQMQARLKQPNS